MKCVKSPAEIQNAPLLAWVGYCKNREEEAELVAAGVPEKQIWMEGRGSESLKWALSWLRGRAGKLMVACDFRIFGKTRAEMMAVLKEIELANATPADVRTPKATLADLIHAALVCISNARFTGDRRKARRLGERGGKAKGTSAWISRNEIAPRWLIENMVAMFGAVKTAAALDNKISASTLRRQYVAQPST